MARSKPHSSETPIEPDYSLDPSESHATSKKKIKKRSKKPGKGLTKDSDSSGSIQQKPTTETLIARRIIRESNKSDYYHELDTAIQDALIANLYFDDLESISSNEADPLLIEKAKASFKERMKRLKTV